MFTMSQRSQSYEYEYERRFCLAVTVFMYSPAVTATTHLQYVVTFRSRFTDSSQG